jgi:hypothetical protein
MLMCLSLNQGFHPAVTLSHEDKFPGNVDYRVDLPPPTCAAGEKFVVELIIDRIISTPAPMQAQACVCLRLEAAQTFCLHTVLGKPRAPNGFLLQV